MVAGVSSEGHLASCVISTLSIATLHCVVSLYAIYTNLNVERREMNCAVSILRLREWRCLQLLLTGMQTGTDDDDRT